MKRWPLRIQITLLVSLVLALTCAALTANSIYSAQGYYSILEERGAIPDDPLNRGLEASYPISPYAIATHRFSTQSVAVMLAAILLSGFVTYCLTGRLLRPLTSLTSSIHDIDQGSLHRRVELPDTAREVRALAESFNGMLDRLENSFEIQKNFAANAAHELKTPLAVLKTSLQVLELDEAPNSEDYREFVTAAKAGVDRLTSTVDALMALAQGGGELEPVALRPLLKLVVSELATKAEAAGVTLSLSGDCPPVRGDQTLLYRAFFNLVENAIKYSRPGGRVEASLSLWEGRSRIQVSDTGIGMSQDAARHAFEPFYRADGSRSQKIPGAGLGLSVVKNIVERHGGEIALESTEGVGTAVTLTL